MLDTESEPAAAGRLRRFGWIALVVAGIAVLFGIVTRSRSENSLRQWTEAQAIPSVAVVLPQRGTGEQELVLPGDIEAYYEAPIHARVSGYLKMWYEDIGAHVKAGQLLAQIDTPDLDQQLLQAQADLASARAEATLAEVTASRWKSSAVAKAVAQQTIDDKVGAADARLAQATAAAANVRRLTVMESFKRIVAPFDGIVISRKTDIGALISASGESGPELFSVADLHAMRVYMRVPQALSGILQPGIQARLTLPQFPDRVFTAKLATTANAVERDSRTVLAEFLADNADGALLPGTYAEAHLPVPADRSALRLPASALIFRQEGLRVAVVDQSGKVDLRPVTLGRDLGTEVEVVSGVGAADRVIDSPPDSIAQGDEVKLETTQGNARQAGNTPAGSPRT